MYNNRIEFFVGYQKFSVSENTYEKIEGTALDAIISGRHSGKTMMGLPQIDRPQNNIRLLLEYLELGTMPTDKNEKDLLIKELKLWCFDEADNMIIQEIMNEPITHAVGKKCYQTWNELGPLNI